MTQNQFKDSQDVYPHEIEQIGRELTDITARINAFEAKSKASIQGDRSIMLSELQRMVKSVEGTIRSLNSNESQLAGSTESGALILSGDTSTSEALVSTHLNDMDVTCNGLHTTASASLERVEHIKKTFDDMEVEVTDLRCRLTLLSKRTATALTSAKQALAAQRVEAAGSRTKLEATQVELQTLESKTEHRKLGRNLLRGARIATWSVSVVFPPAVVAAGGLEYGAHKMRQRLRDLQDEIDTTSIRLSTLASEVSTMEGRVVSLDMALVNARSLGSRVDALEADSAGIKTLVNEQLHEYQALKESTDDFAAWTRGVADETATTRLLGLDSQAALRRTTRQVVKRILESEQGDIKAICGNLERLVISSS